MFGLFGRKSRGFGRNKGLSLLQQQKGVLRAKYANTPIPPHKAEGRIETETVPGSSFASRCIHCEAFNIHIIEKGRSGTLAFICTKCNEIYEVDVIADSP